MKRNVLIDIENKIKTQWDEEKINLSYVDKSKKKFFATFPYPYMNGYLHLGHAFTMCKVDFTCRYKRLQGYNVLFPFGFHCTGMPISAAAKKLEYELATIPDIQSNPNEKLQYNILKYYGLSHESIIKFIDPIKWIEFFPLRGLEDIKSFDLMVDTSRSFITTDLNKFYDSFIQYQFEKLYKSGLLKYGTRNSVYSSNLDIQCQDHDRSKGEGVGIGEFILYTLDSISDTDTDSKNKFIFVVKKDFVNKNPETNNFTILLDTTGEFIKFRHNDQIYWCSKYIFENIVHQNILELDDLVQYDKLILTNDNTQSEIIKQIIGLFSTTGQEFKQVDNIGLTESIKSASFDSIDLVKLTGYAIKPIQTNVKNNLLNLFEINLKSKSIWLTNDVITDRTGKICHVKPLPQWYINYADKDWKEKTIGLVKKYAKSSEDITNTLISNINNLNEWGVSRQFGLGSRLPCDKSELIDSLSDSTIYPAFYTISNLLQSNIFGQPIGDINYLDFNYEVWEYIFSNTDLIPQQKTNSSIDLTMLNKLRESFDYWYPVDLRISGKDLLTNHLVMYLFNHAVCFGEKYFPQTIFANGWVLIDGVKMSKSNGNFVTINELMGKVPIDSIRFTLADSGDDLTDANFVRSNATDVNLLKIYDWVEHIKDLVKPDSMDKYRSGEINELDMIFVNLIRRQICLTIQNYEDFRFRDVLIEMFFNFNGLREKYKLYCGLCGYPMHKDIVTKFCHSQTVLMNPIIPHVTEFVWREILSNHELIYNSANFDNLIISNLFDLDKQSYSVPMLTDWDYLTDLVKQTQAAITKNCKKKNWSVNKVIFKYDLKYFNSDMIEKIFEKIIGYPIEIDKLDRPKQYFIFSI
jgi:leucyl-tRNA synthetase